ncbi:hypothetical protein AUK40_02295 [Candidatus Wirthbacteria bacterium CG2_30_54_11]|uniref:Secreted protein n=1 Tax=Candidatus Wirthbacteria bacterium CG2_30_54_11 TaxID=1817892 RepID=A0A1J5ILH0_9BACT|nr:MAG: hypothetical protein AUK40_02295 [Candidatus Wirthbacteria bacterium CG2_30_54_11]
MNRLNLVVKGLFVSGFLAMVVGMHLSEAQGATTKDTGNDTTGTTTGVSTATTAVQPGAVAVMAGWWPTSYFGKTTISRDSVNECCYNSASLALGENTRADRTKKASISFHNAGIAEGSLEMAADNNPRRLSTLDHQNYGLSLEVSGVVMARQGAPACGGVPEGFSFTGDGCQDTGMFSMGDGDLRFISNQQTKMYIDAGGNVCIGSCQ